MREPCGRTHPTSSRARSATQPLVGLVRGVLHRASVLVRSHRGDTSKVRSDLQSGGWGADYPAASDFVQLKLSCAAFHPGSNDNPNAGGFCSPPLDRSIDHARRLQLTDPALANRLWSKIDRTLVDRAAWLPLVTPTNTTFVSARVGNYQYHPLWGPLVDQFRVR